MQTISTSSTPEIYNHAIFTNFIAGLIKSCEFEPSLFKLHFQADLFAKKNQRSIYPMFVFKQTHYSLSKLLETMGFSDQSSQEILQACGLLLKSQTNLYHTQQFIKEQLSEHSYTDSNGKRYFLLKPFQIELSDKLSNNQKDFYTSIYWTCLKHMDTNDATKKLYNGFIKPQGEFIQLIQETNKPYLTNKNEKNKMTL